MRGRFVKIFSIIFSTVFFSLFFVRFTQAKCIPDQCNSQEDCNKLIPNEYCVADCCVYRPPSVPVPPDDPDDPPATCVGCEWGAWYCRTDYNPDTWCRSWGYGCEEACWIQECAGSCEVSSTEITNCISPNGTITSLNQTLTWDATTNATKYQYKIGSSGSIINNALNLTKAVTLPTNTGTWYARGVIGSATTPWSGCTWSYTPPCTCDPWSAWGTCSTDCGTGTQTRTRSCTPDACLAESESQSCTVYNDIDATLNAFGSCSTACDSGTQSATCNDTSYCNGATCTSVCSTAGGVYDSSTNLCTRDCSTSCPPKGYLDSAECLDEEGPNLKKIRMKGWACDPSDYDEPLTIHSYLDGVYKSDGSGGTFINPAAIADNPRETAVGSQCGGFSSHGFDYISTASYPSGDHEVRSFAINIGDHPDVNSQLGDEITVTCCSPAPGNLGEWSTCTSGTQTSTCTGYYCGGSCTDECTADGGTYDLPSHTCTRNCFSIEGYIWSDDNGTTGRQVGDNFKAATDHPTGCYTNKIFPGFTMTATSESGNQISDDNWVCRGETNGAYYSTPYSSTTKSIEPESTKTFSLTTIPSYYDYVGWEFWYHNGTSAILSNSGTGSTASNLVMPATASWLNIHWKLARQMYVFQIIIKEFPPDERTYDCGTISTKPPLEGAAITVRNASNDIVCQGTSDANGVLNCLLWVNEGPLSINVTKETSGDTPDNFRPICPVTSDFQYDPGIPAKGSTHPADPIGLQKIYKRGWVSVIDSDIFANRTSLYAPAGLTDNSSSTQVPRGFSKTLLNSYVNDADNNLGFLFSETTFSNNLPNINDPCPRRKVFETNPSPCSTNYGGYSYNLASSYGNQHDSKWLAGFTFKPPSGADDNFEFNNITSGKVYKKDSVSLPNSYTITGGTGVSILYIDEDLDINNKFTTTSTGRLLLVVDGSVSIDADVGADVSTFQMTDNPNIMAGIIASGSIVFEKIDDSGNQALGDKPIMMTSPLISKVGIVSPRDLNHENNAIMPAESVKAFNKYIYLLSALERDQSEDNLYYTGLTTYDLDWEYIY